MKKLVRIPILCTFLLICGGLFAQGFVQATLTNANQSIALAEKQVLEIRLPSTPSNGFGWYLKENNSSALIAQVEQSSFESDQPENMEGSSGSQIIRYIPTGKGSCNLELEYRRPWESEDLIASTYKLQVNCEGAYSGNYIPLTLDNTIIEPSNTSRALPVSFTWAKESTVAKNQGSCGSCWSFATCGVFEAVINIWDKNVRDLSEQWLVNCDKSSSGCDGGTYAYKMFVNNGAVYEADQTYKAKDGTCGSSYNYHEKAKTYGTVSNDVTKMKQALYDYGPMYVSICAGSNLQNYKSGVISKTDGTKTNHGVVLTGWNDTDGCWIIKNSWGSSWGEKGYFRIKYGLSAVGTKVAYVDYKGKIPHSTTGININQNKDLVVFPNPSNEGLFTISGLTNTSKIEVVDLLGKSVYTQTMRNAVHTLDISHLNKGVYFYQVTDLQNNETANGKLIFN